MWGKNEQPAPPVPPNSGAGSARQEPKIAPAAPVVRSAPPETAADSPSAGRIGKSVVMKAQISAKEDLYIDGELEGAVEMPGYNLTVGPNGKVSANVKARNVAVHGVLRGNVQATEKVEIRKTGSLLGDLTTAGVTIEDGAYFKGSIDIVRPAPAQQRKPDGPPVVATVPAAPVAAPAKAAAH